MYKDINATEFQEKAYSNDNNIIIDVRTPSEWAEGKLKNAQLINIMDGNFTNEIEKLDKSKPYYIYCKSGGRSGRACAYMASIGFNELYNLSGGIMSWMGELE